MLPDIMHSSQCLFGTAENKAGTAIALKAIAAAVPKQAPLYLTHDTKSCSSSLYSNFRSTAIYSDDKLGTAGWRSEHKSRYKDQFDAVSLGDTRGSIQVEVSDGMMEDVKDIMKSKFERRGLTKLTQTKAMAQKPIMAKLFHVVDVDNSGAICRSEFVTLCRSLGIHKSKHQIEALYGEMDGDANGKLTFREVWRWYTHSWAHLFAGGAG